MNRQAILNKIENKEEKIMLAQVLDKLMLCDKSREKAFSDFLDPAKCAKFFDIISREKLDIQVLSYGGALDCERKLLGFSPDYEELQPENFPIEKLMISYSHRAATKLSHRDFLGAIMGLGISRSRVGDIIVTDAGALVFVLLEFSEYICGNLDKVGTVKVEVSKSDNSDLPAEIRPTTELRLTVTSLRLDCVISSAFRISRSKSAGLIDGEKVFINWSLATNPSKQIAEGDMITVRGIGRVHFTEISGKTKKDRFAILVKKSI